MLQHCSGGRGATDTLFHNEVDLFRNFGGKVPFLSMCQQVLSKIVDLLESMKEEKKEFYSQFLDVLKNR